MRDSVAGKRQRFVKSIEVVARANRTIFHAS
jgi:hypothetical protein